MAARCRTDSEVAVRQRAGVVLGSMLLLVSACSHGASRPNGRASSTAAAPSSSSAPAGDAVKPFLTRTANFYGPNGHQRTVRLDVFPAVRVDAGLLVPVDLTAEGSDKPAGSDYFCDDAVVCSDFGASSLVDSSGLVRYGPLRDGSASGAVLSSTVPFELALGTRYRAGVLFPAPGRAASSIDLDLQYGGPVLGLPVTSGPPPQGLLDGSDPGRPSPAGGVTTLPVQAAKGTPFLDRHPLQAKVVGGRLNQSGSARQGVVSLAADVLFAFNSATLTAPAKAIVQQAAQILTDKADATHPVGVTGYTDAKGTDSYNASLSQRRAAAVADALHTASGGAALTLRPVGRGAADPVAPNALPDGTDDPAGRALNRRVELAYTPKAPPTPPAAPPAAAAAPESGNGQPLATLTAPRVIASGAGAVAMTAAVRSVRRDGALTVVEVGVTPTAAASGVDSFGRGRNNPNLGAWRLVAAATSAAYVPATDVDDPMRVLGTTVKQMNAGREYLLTFWTAALPADLSTVDVVLGQLGRAKNIAVSP